MVKGVLVGLFLLDNLWSWAVIIDKQGPGFAALDREADRFEDKAVSGRSLEEVAVGRRGAAPSAHAAGFEVLRE